MDKKKKILIIDDDKDILDLLEYNLSREGYKVKKLSDGTKAIKSIKKFLPHLIILDILMPKVNGIEVCKEIRREESIKDVYVFFLTANAEEYYQHAVFEVGGDEFVEKITGLKPLLKKITCVLKEKLVIRKSLPKISEGEFEIWRSSNAVYFNGRQLSLDKLEFEMLYFLTQNSKKVISVNQLIQVLWGSTFLMEASNIKMLISKLQDKLDNHLFYDDRAGLLCFS